MTSGQRVNDRQKRGSFLFKMLFHLSRSDFRFSRYRRVKRRVIFDRLPSPSSSLTRTSRSHLVSLTYTKLQTSGRRNSWKSVVRVSRKKMQVRDPFITSALCKRYGHFKSLYLSNQLRYRDKSKRKFNGMFFSMF